MKRLWRVLLKMLAASAVLTMLAASAAMAQTVVDQENTGSGTPNEYVYLDFQADQAQTFTAEVYAHLDSVSLYLKREGAENFRLNYGVGPADENGHPRRWGDASIPAASIPESGGWVTLPLPEDWANGVSAGQQYSIYLYETCDPCTEKPRADKIYIGATGDLYAGGSYFQWDYPSGDGWIDQGKDWMFKTHVEDTTRPTGTVLINQGDYKTSQRLVTLYLNASDPEPSSGIAGVRMKNENGEWSLWKRYNGEENGMKNWYLSPGEGTKRVAVQYRDAAGNRSAPVYDYIVFKR
jgi:hypothetical protein